MARSESVSIDAPPVLNEWLPTRAQMVDAVRFNLADAIDGDEVMRAFLDERPATTMRQGLGLIVATAIIAGFVPFLVGWLLAARAGTVTPLVSWSANLMQRSAAQPGMTTPVDILAETAQAIAGLHAPLPSWLAAGLSALGHWINWPLSWLAWWIVFGLAVLVTAKLLGATTTLQRFYAATSYAVIPLILTGLTLIPCVGAVAALVGVIGSLVVYVQAVQHVTRFGVGRAVVSVLAPVAVAAVLVFLATATIGLALLRLVLG